jgi:hypothetical protein
MHSTAVNTVLDLLDQAEHERLNTESIARHLNEGKRSAGIILPQLDLHRVRAHGRSGILIVPPTVYHTVQKHAPNAFTR